MTDIALFELTTAIAPPKTFTIDGAKYSLRDMRHLSDREEAQFRVLYKKDERAQKMLESSAEREDWDEVEAQSIALRHSRVDLIRIMTDAPAEILAQLPLDAQGKLIEAITQPDKVEREREAELAEKALREAEAAAIAAGRVKSKKPAA